MQKLEKILDKLEKLTFEAEVYNDDFDGTSINNLICLGDVREVLEEQMADDWIPCSERLPDPNTEVMCCYDNGGLDMMWQDWKSRGKSGLIYGDIDGTTHKVVAWRPLPDPYRPEVKNG